MTEGLRVKCNGCGKVLHETTDKYDSNITPNGSMVRLIDPWKSWGWTAFDDAGQNISTTSAVMMSCPACSAPLVLNGKLNIVAEPEKPKTQVELNQKKIDESFKEVVEEVRHQDKIYTCKLCGREIKGTVGYKSHLRACEKKHNKIDKGEQLI